MGRYAEGTTVAPEKSRGEIERTLVRYGATGFAYGWTGDKATVQFVASNRQVRFVITLPDRGDRKFTHHSRGVRTPEAAHDQWEQACRQSWRALALVVKAKLEAVDAGISEFEDEFLAHIVLPDGTTAGAWLRPQIAAAYESGDMPPMLALGAGGAS